MGQDWWSPGHNNGDHVEYLQHPKPTLSTLHTLIHTVITVLLFPFLQDKELQPEISLTKAAQ